MSMYSTLEEAIDAAREEFLANHPELEEGMHQSASLVCKSM